MKKVASKVLIVVLLLSLTLAFFGCSAGTYYLYNPITKELNKDAYIKLGSSGSIEITVGELTSKFKLKDGEKLGYKVDGENIKVVIKGKDSDGKKVETELTVLGLKIKDGEISALGGLFTFKKK